MAAFPASLYVNRSGYSASVDGYVHTSDIPGGVFTQVIDNDSAASQAAVTVRTDRDGKDVFKSFYVNDIFEGSAMFTIDLDLGAGVMTQNAQIVSGPEYAGDDDPLWSVTMTLEVENMAEL